MASTELKRTISSAGSQTKWGASAWVKRGDLGLSAGVYCSSKSDTTANTRGIFFQADDQLECAFYDGGYSFQVKTNAKYRDTNAWYHVVVNVDTSQSTASDRVKIYVNGVQETSMATSSYPNQNATFNFLGTDITQLVGSLREGSSIHHSCVISHLHFTDGYCYPASTFGSTDSTTGEWKINTSPTVANYGTNGFFILKDGNSVTDQSGNSNNLTVSAGTLTKTEDCPSNVFATLNPLSIFGGNNSPTLSNGNTTLSTVNSDAHKGLFMSSLGMTQGSGKFYCEIKAEEAQRLAIGVCNKNVFLSSNSPDGQSNQAAITYYYSGHVYYDSNGEVSGASSFANNDILGIALDMENNRLFFHKNGTYMNSGDPTSSTGNVLTFTNAAQYVENHEEMFFFVSDLSTSGTGKALVNFGNGYFGTTAVSSAGTNASGVGIFEYDVPTGYTALSTKGLNL